MVIDITTRMESIHNVGDVEVFVSNDPFITFTSTFINSETGEVGPFCKFYIL
jgi:hypothetical protein